MAVSRHSFNIPYLSTVVMGHLLLTQSLQLD